MANYPTFMYGPKDGSAVPDALWVLDKVEMIHHLPNGKNLVYCYELNEKDHNYYFKGQFEDTGGEYE